MEIYQELQKQNNICSSPLFSIMIDMNMSDSDADRIKYLIHSLLEQRGEAAAMEKIVDIFRVNPLLAVKILESCSLYEYAENILYGMKLLLASVEGHYSSQDTVVLNPDKTAFTVLLIEAAFQNSVRSVWDTKDTVLNVAKERSQRAYQQGNRSRILGPDSIRHIVRNVPGNRHVELINWFWNQHCYAAQKFDKAKTFMSTRVEIIMKELGEASLWKHVENVNTSQLSHREQGIKIQERKYLAEFIRNVIDERNHLHFVEQALGKDDMEQKIVSLLGEYWVEKYHRNKKLQEDQSSKGYYRRLAQRIKEKYQRLENQPEFPLQWHNLKENPKFVQLNLWNYWQGCNFDDVALMVVKQEWGSVNQKDEEMEKCHRRLKALSNGQFTTPYYSCAYATADRNLEKLFDRSFSRKIRTEHYPDLFFTTLCFGYRRSKDSVVTDELIRSDVDDFLLPELAIIRPKAILCLGEKVYQFLEEGLAENGILLEHLGQQEGILCSRAKIHSRETMIYRMPFCGGKMDQQERERQQNVWNALRRDLEEKGIRL